MAVVVCWRGRLRTNLREGNRFEIMYPTREEQIEMDGKKPVCLKHDQYGIICMIILNPRRCK
jgi:hypothetical protein